MKNNLRDDVAEVVQLLLTLLTLTGVVSVAYNLVDLLTRVPNWTIIPFLGALVWVFRDGEVSTYSLYSEGDKGEDSERASA